MQYLAWPAVVFLLGLVAIFVFRGPLSRFLDRAKRIGKDGIEAGQSIQEKATEIKPSPTEDFLKSFDNALLVKREEFIRNELLKLQINQPTEREKVLIRLLAAFSLIQAFENAYMFIWGSQIGVLEYLNSASQDTPLDFLKPWYEEAVGRQPELYKNYSFDQWLGFLEGHYLIVRRGGAVTISLEGREFLKYLVDRGYSLYKRG
jgi:hypothetical protein